MATEHSPTTFQVQTVSSLLRLDGQEDILADYSNPTLIQRLDTNDYFVLYPLVMADAHAKASDSLFLVDSEASPVLDDPLQRQSPQQQPSSSSLKSQTSLDSLEAMPPSSFIMSSSPPAAPKQTSPLDDLWLAFNKN
jgi:hypothetical protein